MPNTNLPLHTAVQNGNIEIVKMLLDAGCNPNEVNSDGLTPLHIAAQMGLTDIAALLVDKINENNSIAAQPPPADLFCTNCGNSIDKCAAVCMSCGAKPVGHKKFCRYCGVGINPEQVICIKCEEEIVTADVPHSVGSSSKSLFAWQKNKWLAGILAVFFGWAGVHKYYMGSWGWGLVFTVVLFLTYGVSILVTIPVSVVEAVKFFFMPDDVFAAKYAPGTERAFRW